MQAHLEMNISHDVNYTSHGFYILLCHCIYKRITWIPYVYFSWASTAGQVQRKLELEVYAISNFHTAERLVDPVRMQYISMYSYSNLTINPKLRYCRNRFGSIATSNEQKKMQKEMAMYWILNNMESYCKTNNASCETIECSSNCWSSSCDIRTLIGVEYIQTQQILVNELDKLCHFAGMESSVVWIVTATLLDCHQCRNVLSKDQFECNPKIEGKALHESSRPTSDTQNDKCR